MTAMSTPSRTSTLAVGTMVLLTALYFAQGLPYGFFSQAVPVILREEGYSLTQISVYGLLFAPWGLKFLWAPYVDRYGTRRRWLLAMQLTSATIALVLAFLDLSGTLVWLLVGIAVINLASAPRTSRPTDWRCRASDPDNAAWATGSRWAPTGSA